MKNLRNLCVVGILEFKPKTDLSKKVTCELEHPILTDEDKEKKLNVVSVQVRASKPQYNCILHALNETYNTGCLTKSSTHIPAFEIETKEPVEFWCVSVGTHPSPSFKWYLQVTNIIQWCQIENQQSTVYDMK